METSVRESDVHITDGVEAHTDYEYDDFDDSDYDFGEDRWFETFVDDDVGFSKGKDAIGAENISDELLHRMQQNVGDDDCVNDDEVGIPLNYGEMQKIDVFDLMTESENPELKLGLIFNSKKEAKFAIQSHCIREGMLIRFVKNDDKRLRAQCRNDGCKWVILVSKMSNDICWQVKILEGKHNNRFWDFKNKCINSTWFGKIFADKFIANPKLGSNEFRNEISTSLHAEISRKMSYLVKRKALRLAKGSAEEQFSHIRNFCAELKRTDRDTTIILKLTEDTCGPRFQRMCVCFSACESVYNNSKTSVCQRQ